jgi:hypothetical protein
MMGMEFKGIPINDHARIFLSKEGLSENLELGKLRMALLTVFVPKHKNENSDTNRFRKDIICTDKTNPSSVKYLVMQGKKNSIYNALCLIYLIGAGEARKLFQDYYKTKATTKSCDVSKLEEQNGQQYLEFFCLGIVRDSIDKIIECIHSPKFDLFTNKLPSPFTSNLDNQYDLSPMLQLYEKDIPWKEYMDCYERAEQLFEIKAYPKAKQVLCELEEKALLRLPIVESLNKKIKAQEYETKQAWDYIQQKL